MLLKVVLLIVASEGYQPLEYGHTRKVLEESGVKVLVASDRKGTASAYPSAQHSKVCDDPACRTVGNDYSSAKVDVVLSDVNVNDYDGIFIVGGPGALEFLDNQITYGLMQKMAKAAKPFGAICISPRILAKAGLLGNKEATGWNGDHKLEDIFKKFNVIYRKKSAVIDGNIVTADGPKAAEEFGKAIVQVLSKIN